MVLGDSDHGEGTVHPMHITCSVFIDDDESGIHYDYGACLERTALHQPVSQYCHDGTCEDNADALVRRQVAGGEVIAPVSEARLGFDTGQQIFYAKSEG